MLLKHSTAASLALGLLIGVIGCSGDFAVDVSVEGSRLSVVSGTLDFTYLGEVATLTLEVLDKKGQPIRANPNGVQWSVSDASVAEVDKNGVVTAVGNGTTQVQARSGSSTSTASITVKQLITKIAVEPATFGVYVGQEVAVDAAAYDAGGSVVPGTTASWSSSASTIASVSNGRVKGVSQGSTTVLATIEGRSAAADVSVNEVQVGDPTVLRIISGSSQTGTSGAALDAPLEVAVLDDFDDPVPGIDVTWSAHDGGSITAIVSTTGSDGRASARWTLGPDEGEQVAHASVGELTAVFTATATKVTSTVASLTVAPASLTLDALGATAQLAAAVRDQNGALIADADVAWSSSSTVAAVDTNGKVTAKSVGTALIIASVAGLADTAHVTVRQVPASVELSSSSVSLNVGETHQLNAEVKDAGGTAIPSASVTWSSSAPHVASVSSDGRVSAIAAGSATVTAASESLTASASVTVTGTATPPGPEPGPGIWLSASEIAALPTSGTAWNNLKKAADSNLRGGVLTHRDNHNTRVMAAALVAARLNDNTYRARVRDALVDLIAAPYGTEDGLARNRRLGTYAIAAELIGLHNFDPGVDASFRTWLAVARDTHLTSGGGGTLAGYHERRPNNYGNHAGFSRMAVALYLGNQAEFERAVVVFRGYLGDRSAYEGFQFREDFTWHEDPDRPLGVNPKGATKRDDSGTLRNIDGVMPDDQRRCGSFQWPPCVTNYAWEGLQGAIGMAWLAHRQGHDAVSWSDQALLRAVTWLITQAEFPAVGDDVWQMHLVNYMYGTSFPAASPTQPGKNIGWTDWTHQ